MSSPDAASGVPIESGRILKPFTTFKIGGPARYFIPASSEQDIRAALAFVREKKLPIFILGGGSNILVSDRGFPGLVVHPEGRGISLVHEDAATVKLCVQAAENWDGVAAYAVERGWWGIENLSHIPGQAGAALVQNIGAYGQQISDVLDAAEVMEVATGAVRKLLAGDCGFEYRRSIFNATARGQFVILSVILTLQKQGQPNLSYPDVQGYFQEKRGTPSLQEIRGAIIATRDRKFPFPWEERGGNAGSFFKNLELAPAEYDALLANVKRSFSRTEVERLEAIRNRFPTQGRIRIPTAFLIDLCGLKGHRAGGAQVNESQPLVILNQGGATARDVLTLARHVRRTLFVRTGMVISLEPELVGFTQEEIAEFLSLE